MNSGNVPGVHFLLSLIEPDDAAAVRRRLGIDEPKQRTDHRAATELAWLPVPQSALLWMLERDDPATNDLVLHRLAAAEWLQRDILRGLPFGGAAGPLPVPEPCDEPSCAHHKPEVLVSGQDVIAGLRAVRTMRSARAAARVVRRHDWTAIAEADRSRSLPGYARWALAGRIDCPPRVRTQFGTHPKFAHRLRTAGIVEPAEYAELGTPARHVLGVLYFGIQLFPRRTDEAAAALAPLVRDAVGANPDAWAVLAQLLPTFTGTARELVRTSGAIATA